jgi:hypothetical protein
MRRVVRSIKLIGLSLAQDRMGEEHRGMVSGGGSGTSAAGSVTAPAMLPGWYPMTGPNEPVRLYDGDLVLNVGQKSHRVPGSVRLDWLPTPRLMAMVGSDAVAVGLDAVLAGSEDEPVLTLPLSVVPEPPRDPAPSYDEFSWHADTWMSPVVVSPGAAAVLAEVSFLVVNLPFAIGGGRLSEGSRRWMGRSLLTGGGWSVTLDARPDHREVEQRLRAAGGYGITHAGRLAKNDGAAFAAADAENALAVVRYTLSLASGRWVAPVLPVGLDSGGKPVWTVWQHELIHPYRGSHRLADPVTAGHLPELFAAVMSRWEDPFERQVVTRAIHYYLEANEPDPVELAVSSAQAGLELLAWTELVEDTRRYTAKAYKDRPAHQTLAEFLTGHSISTALPANLQALSAEAANHGCSTGPEIITRMRNGVIHPSRRKPVFPLAAWVDAWRLAMHYLQLALLAYLGYQGTHRDPLSDIKHPGQVQQVPWG